MAQKISTFINTCDLRMPAEPTLPMATGTREGLGGSRSMEICDLRLSSHSIGTGHAELRVAYAGSMTTLCDPGAVLL